MRPPDFREFWNRTLDEILAQPLDPAISESDYEQVGVLDRRWDVSWTGLGGERVGGWLWRPHTCRERMPAIVYYPGYGGKVWDRADLARRGYIVFACSPRGGSLSDPAYAERIPSQLCEGLDAPARHAFRGVYADAVQAVEFVRSLPEVDAESVYACGASWGAACAIAAAAVGGKVRGVSAEMPFVTDFPYVFDNVRTSPYSEVTDYVRLHTEKEASARTTLAYFDTVSLAPDVCVPTILSYGEADLVCPPPTIRALFDALSCVKALVAYPGRQHDRSTDFLDLSIAFFRSHT